jgi:hypothetical protein
MNHVGASPLPPGVMYFDAFVSPERKPPSQPYWITVLGALS